MSWCLSLPADFPVVISKTHVGVDCMGDCTTMKLFHILLITRACDFNEIQVLLNKIATLFNPKHPIYYKQVTVFHNYKLHSELPLAVSNKHLNKYFLKTISNQISTLVLTVISHCINNGIIFSFCIQVIFLKVFTHAAAQSTVDNKHKV